MSASPAVAARTEDALNALRAFDFAAAEQACLDVLAVVPDDVNGAYLLAQVYRRTSRAAMAFDLAARAAARHSRVAELQNLLGELHFEQGRTDAAAAAFRQAAALKPSYAEAHYNLGRTHGAAKLGTRPTDPETLLSRPPTFGRPDTMIFSCFNEQEIVRNLMERLSGVVEYCIDIGAGDGIGYSNSYGLFRRGWRGAVFEAGAARFARLAAAIEPFGDRVNAARCFVTPDNLAALFTALDVPAEPGFLTLDIDSYDYDVLAAALKAVRPAAVCVEINERVHPAIDLAFRHRRDRNSPMAGTLMSGASVRAFVRLFDACGYGVVGLEYNNLFAVDRRRLAELPDMREMTAEEAWRTGFFDRPDWRTKMPWNEKYLSWFDGPEDVCRENIRHVIAPFAEDFTLA